MLNWKVRFTNPVFVAQLVALIVLTLVSGTGAQWSEMTSWPVLGAALLKAIQNPVVVATLAVAVYNTFKDPTTPGFADSKRALDYVKPGTPEIATKDITGEGE